LYKTTTQWYVITKVERRGNGWNVWVKKTEERDESKVIMDATDEAIETGWKAFEELCKTRKG
jgi:hypothetical protein